MVNFDVHQVLQRALTALVAGALFLGSLLFLPVIPLTLVWAALWVYICIYEMPPLVPFANSGYYGFLLLYPTLPFLSLLGLLLVDHSRMWVLLLFTTVFCHDTAAYIFGRLFGRHRMCPQISPQKTWEGFFGGVLAIALIVVRSYQAGFTAWSPSLALLFVVLPFVATAGDLFVSSLKRHAGLKDTGTILPGHGGLLDRADSVLFTAPLFLAVYFLSAL